jgi:hypothetical protein
MTTSGNTPPPPPPPPTPAGDTQTFKVPEELKAKDIGVLEIYREQRNLFIRFEVSKKMRGDIKVLLTGTWDTDVYQLRDRAKRKGFEDDKIELLVTAFGHIYSGEAADYIAKVRAGTAKAEAQEKLNQATNAEDDKKPKVFKHYIHKYRDPNGGLELYEAILLGNNAHFISIDRDAETQKGQIAYRLSNGFKISNSIANSVTEILPKEQLAYISKPYQFESEKEIAHYLQVAANLTLDSLYTMVKAIVKKYIAASDEHHTIVAGDCIFTYFQDVFGQTHYLYFYGDNGTGKTINLQLLSLLGYRAMYDVDITAANIYTYFGTIEEGQGIILEDESDDLDYKQQEKMKIYKKGYNAGGKVSRTETGGDSGRVQDGYFVYGFKAFTGEEKLDPDYAKGFNERTFYIKCTEGDPQYDLSEVTSPAGAEEYEKLRQELESLHKTLLMFRLIHYTDKFPNIDVAVKNREKQLTKPLMRLFQDAPTAQKEIAAALGKLIERRRGVKKNTLEYGVYKAVDKLIEENKRTAEKLTNTTIESQTYKFTAKLVYISVKDELEGEYVKDAGKDQSFETPMHGKVSHKKISQICEGRFGADIKHTRNGNALVFDKDLFAKVKAAYSLADSGVQIIKVKDMKDMKDSSKEGRVSGENKTEVDDGNQTESEEEVENSEEMEEEAEDFEGKVE